MDSVLRSTILGKTYDMVDDPSTDSTISWSESGKSFIVWNPKELSRDVIPRFFGFRRDETEYPRNFSLFAKLLNRYGFRRVDSEEIEFADHDFVRGEPDLVRHICKRKIVRKRDTKAGKDRLRKIMVMRKPKRKNMKKHYVLF
ncbi:hypothetical protein CARUB_v10024599mg [Capsella rubella]|uniref:TFhs1 n=1 Tax=Capsella rubella TaxID=81985 RepID=B2BXU4_9BRAS|nr:heat stress transcription factor A-4a [Capsella rubella]ABW81131.1 TFhs1 [Capsella rubella]EOA28393.1 hypothetical protein CARUB_v10024599mg [Capsella rubella]